MARPIYSARRTCDGGRQYAPSSISPHRGHAHPARRPLKRGGAVVFRGLCLVADFALEADRIFVLRLCGHGLGYMCVSCRMAIGRPGWMAAPVPASGWGMVFPLDGFDSGPVDVKAVVLYVLQSRTIRGWECCSCRWADRNIPDANLTVGMHERTMDNSNMNNNSNHRRRHRNHRAQRAPLQSGRNIIQSPPAHHPHVRGTGEAADRESHRLRTHRRPRKQDGRKAAPPIP